MNRRNYLQNMITENDSVGSYFREINQHFLNMKEETINYLIDTALNVNEDYLQYNKDVTEINDLLNQNDENIRQLLLLNMKIRKKLTTLCNHEWVIDLIDLDLDRSKTIEYCKICQCQR
jgi:hypothetical protein